MNIIVLILSSILFFGACSSSRDLASDNSPKTQVDREGIRKTFFKNQKTIRSCYEKSLNKNPDLEGKVLLDFDIDKKGQVIRAVIDQQKSSLNDKEVHTCLLDKLNTFSFPKPLNGTNHLNIRYPLGFAPKLEKD